MRIPEQLLYEFFSSEFPGFDKTRTSSGEYRINSILGNDRKRKTYINLGKQVFKDQKNQVGGNIISLISEYKGIPREEVFSYLISNYSLGESGLNIFFDEMIKEEEKKAVRIELPKNIKWFRDIKKDGIISGTARNYLLSRKINPDGLGYVYDAHDNFHQRIIIPYYEDGKLIFYTGRTWIDGVNPKYLNCETEKRGVVYNIDRIVDKAFIMEGILDVMSLSQQVGIPLNGATLQEDQIIKIYDRIEKKIDFVFVPDNDEIGEKTLLKNIKILKDFQPASLTVRYFIYKIPNGYKDFNELYVKTGKDYIDDAEIQSVEDYLLRKKMMSSFA